MQEIERTGANAAAMMDERALRDTDLFSASTGAPSIVERLRLHARTRAGQTAFRFLGDGERESDALTFAELDEGARRIAAFLEGRGLRRERVLLVLPQDLRFIVAFFGCLYAGAVAVPMLVPHPRRSLENFLAIAGNAAAGLVLTTREVRSRLASFAAAIAGLPWACWEDVATAAEVLAEPAVRGDDLALLQYTSGSTGSPKGVMVSHANLAHNEQTICRAFGFSDESVVGGWLPMFHDMGLIGLVLAPAYYGIPSVLMPPSAFLQKPVRWLQMISRHGVTFSGGPNFAYDVCVDRIGEAQRCKLDLSTWRVAFNGAEPVRATTVESFLEAFRAHGFHPRAMYPCYGMAEATLFVAGDEPGRGVTVRDLDADALEQGRAEPARAGKGRVARVVGCGRPWNGMGVEIVDPQTLASQTPGRIGEIRVTGPSVAEGYYDQPTASAAAFRIRRGSRALRTGDFGFLDNGVLYVTGRMKDAMIVRGRNHYPQDIEATAGSVGEHVQRGAAAAFRLDVANEEKIVLVQELTRTGLGTEHRRIALDIQEAVATEHGVALHQIVLVGPGGVPKTTSGKVRRSACRERHVRGDLQVVYLHASGALSNRAVPGTTAVPA